MGFNQDGLGCGVRRRHQRRRMAGLDQRRSFGLQVAKLAGLPEKVLARARQVLGVLEQRAAAGQRSSGQIVGVLDDLPLFAHQPPPPKATVNPLYDKLDQVRADDLTPREAIDLIYELKKIRDATRRN